jgi:excisionase family DNA binding protein
VCCLLAVSRGKKLPAMNSIANGQVLTALQQVVGTTLKNWLDENKADVIQALRAAVAIPQMPPPVAKTVAVAADDKRQPQFLNTAEVAARWQLHVESVRRLVRRRELPGMHVARRVLVPLSAVMEYEKQNTLSTRLG